MANETDKKMRQSSVTREPIPSQLKGEVEAEPLASAQEADDNDDGVEQGEDIDDAEYLVEQTGGEDEINDQLNIYETVEEVVVVNDDELMMVSFEPEEAKPRKLSNIIPHVGLPFQPTEYRCQFCDHVFRYRTTLMNHYQDSHPDEAYTCELCEKSFTAVQTWRAHNCLMNEGNFCCEHVIILDAVHFVCHFVHVFILDEMHFSAARSSSTATF